MADAKSVINLGLGKIAASRVVTLSPPKSAIERHCADGYPVWRNSELAKKDWHFATRTAQLTLSPNDDVDIGDGRVYKYAVPNDLLRPIHEKTTRWQQRGKFIYSASATLSISYIANIAETNWDDLFINVVACRVAMECSEFATQSNTKGDRADDKYKIALSEAARANMFTQGPIDIRTDDSNDEWILARMGTGITE